MVKSPTLELMDKSYGIELLNIMKDIGQIFAVQAISNGENYLQELKLICLIPENKHQ